MFPFREYINAAYSVIEVFNNYIAYICLNVGDLLPEDIDGNLHKFTTSCCFRTIDITNLVAKTNIVYQYVAQYLSADCLVTATLPVALVFLNAVIYIETEIYFHWPSSLIILL